MKCPYCTSEIDAAALACPHCTRDLYLFKPLLEKIAALEERLLKVEAAAVLPVRQEAEALALLPEVLEEPEAVVTPLRQAGEWAGLWLAPLLMLIGAHAVITVLYDLDTLYLRVVSLLIPLPFGFLLMALRPRHFGLAMLAAFAMAGLAVLGMSTVTSLVDQTPVLPVDIREWREFIEYAASVGFSYTTGLLLGWRLWHRRCAQAARRGLTFKLARLVSDENADRLQARVQRFNELSGSLTAALTTAASIYSGLQGVLHK